MRYQICNPKDNPWSDETYIQTAEKISKRKTHLTAHLKNKLKITLRTGNLPDSVDFHEMQVRLTLTIPTKAPHVS